MKCLNCKSTNHETGAKYCPVCGIRLFKNGFIYGNLAFTEQLKVRPETKFVIIHHSGKIKPHTVKDIHRWHINNRKWAGIGYHYFINKAGEVFKGRPVEMIGAHALGYNKNSIAVCFEGDFTKETITDKQLDGDAIPLLHFLTLQFGGTIKFFDELDGYEGNPAKGIRKNDLINSLKKYRSNFQREQEELFGKESAATFYDWVEEECDKFGIPYNR